MLALYRWEYRQSIRQVAKQTGISPATMMRIEHGYAMDLGTWLTLTAWLLERVGPPARKRRAELK